MGKPFDSELQQIPATLSWAAREDTTLIEQWVARVAGEPLYTVGVGGSFTAAKLAAHLHEQRGGFAAAKTTLDFTSSTPTLDRAHVLILTGGGRNRDVLSAFDHAIAGEAKSVLAICATAGSALAQRAKFRWDAKVFDFALPSRRDGFLATNSLVATCLILARSFGEDVSALDGWTPHAALEQTAIDLILGGQETLLVLHSGWGTPAAVDLESKCSEAGLRAVLLCDYRHFAHGRHQWLAAYGSTSAVVAFVSPQEAELAEKTLRLLPSSVPVVRLETTLPGAAATTDLLLKGFLLVAGLGRALGIDPGRPGVPPLGRRLYHLRAHSRSPLLRGSAADAQAISIRRKQVASVIPADWEACYEGFVGRLGRARFSAVVFDFDGTLCGSRDRFRGVSAALRPALVRLATAGVLVGIATGRGKSARDALQNAVPRRFWKHVLVGYHNGTEVASLSDNDAPDTSGEASEELRDLLDILLGWGLEKRCKLDLRPMQLTVEPHSASDAAGVAAVVHEAVAKLASGLRLVYSSHSLDVLGRDASKLNVVAACRGHGGEVLCIGDRGAWPGNDFEMLATPFSLSVDAVSADPNSCWNLAPVGVRCVQATAFYLAGIKADGGKFRFSLIRSLAWLKKLSPHE